LALYEYTCSKCGHTFERIMNRGARAPRCPECGGRTRRLISAPAIHFKGTGWYVTDYARKGRDGRDSKRGSKGSSDSAAATDGTKNSGEKKSEAKPDKTQAGGAKNTDKK